MGFLVNGHSADSIALTDRGLHYGDGVFETIAVVGGQPRNWQLHMERLVEGCRRLRIPEIEPGKLAAECYTALDGQSSAIIKIIVTRGSGGRGYAPPDEATPTRIIGIYPAPAYPAEHYRLGVKVFTSSIPLGQQPHLAGMKHLNRLEQVLAGMECPDDSYAEGVMYGRDGGLVEGISSNIFLVREGRLITPNVDACGVAGIMRGQVIVAAHAAGIGVEERVLQPEEESTAEEIFITNSLIGIWPVRELGKWRGKPGPLTQQLLSNLPPPFLPEEMMR